MQPGITFAKIWSDDGLLELEISTSNGASGFVTKVYVAAAQLTQLVQSLDAFRHHVNGGLHDIRLGQFGPEYVSGAYHARLHFFASGRSRLFVTVHAEGEWDTFTVARVANRATLHLISEPALLDTFIQSLGAIDSGVSDRAFLETVAF